MPRWRAAALMLALVSVAVSACQQARPAPASTASTSSAASRSTMSPTAVTAADTVTPGSLAMSQARASAVSSTDHSLECPLSGEQVTAGGGDDWQLVSTNPTSPISAVVCSYKNYSRTKHRLLTGKQLDSLVAVLNGLKKVTGAYSCGGVIAGNQTLLAFHYADKNLIINVTLGEIGCSLLTNGKLQVTPDEASLQLIRAL